MLDETRVKWIAHRMEMIIIETKERFQGISGVEYRIDEQAVEKKSSTESPEEIEQQLLWEQGMMELLLLYEVMEWEKLFWNKSKDLLDHIGNDRLGGVKERLMREWRADCWKRLNPQMHAAEKRFPDINDYSVAIRNFVGKRWASYISQFFEGVENPNFNIAVERDPISD